MFNQISESHCKNFSLLDKLYRQVNGSTFKAANILEIALTIDINNGWLDDSLQYLREEGLLKVSENASCFYTLTHTGKKAVEDAYTYPDEKTCHFPPLNAMRAANI